MHASDDESRGISADGTSADGASAESVPLKTDAPGDTRAPTAMDRVREQTLADEALDLAAARAGDEEAFARLYDRLAPVVLSLCRRRSLREAEDATQETFIRAHRLLHKVEDPAKLRSWLFAIARNVLSERRRASMRRARHEEQAAMNRSVEIHAARPQDDGVDRAEQLDMLGEAMERLEDRERLAIHLYYLESDPVGAAGSALGLSRSGYYKLLARARERLACLMKERQPS